MGRLNPAVLMRVESRAAASGRRAIVKSLQGWRAAMLTALIKKLEHFLTLPG
jgi:hypothetical protein